MQRNAPRSLKERTKKTIATEPYTGSAKSTLPKHEIRSVVDAVDGGIKTHRNASHRRWKKKGDGARRHASCRNETLRAKRATRPTPQRPARTPPTVPTPPFPFPFPFHVPPSTPPHPSADSPSRYRSRPLPPSPPPPPRLVSRLATPPPRLTRLCPQRSDAQRVFRPSPVARLFGDANASEGTLCALNLEPGLDRIRRDCDRAREAGRERPPRRQRTSGTPGRDSIGPAERRSRLRPSVRAGSKGARMR